MKLSIKNLLFLFLLIPSVLLIIIMYVFFFPDFKRKLEKNAIKNSEYISLFLNEMIEKKLTDDLNKVTLFKESINSNHLYFHNENQDLKLLLRNLLKTEKYFSSAWLLIYDINFSENQKIAKYYKSDEEIIFHISKLKTNSPLFKKFTTEETENLIFVYEDEESRDINSFIISISVHFQFNNLNGRIGINTDATMFGKFFKNITDNDIFESYLFIDQNLIGLSSKNEYKDRLLNTLLENDNSVSDYFFIQNAEKKILVNQKILGCVDDTKSIKLLTVFGDVNNPGYFKQKFSRFLLISLFAILVYLCIIYMIYSTLSKRIHSSKMVIDSIAEGNVKELHIKKDHRKDELSNINESIASINTNLSKTALFIEELEKGNYHFEYESVGKDDRIGNALLRLRNSIEVSKQEEIKRKEIDEQLNWITGGAAKFAEIIREHSDNLQELAYAIISELVNYIGAVQGGLFIINENENNEKYIELLASYAYNRNKMLEKRIEYGVGLVGRCILERETIYMSKVPDNYLNITSGLGDENPRTLLIVPLIFHEEVFGVVELASFNEIENYKIQLTEQISEGIASAVSMVKINVRTAELLRESKIKSEQAASQEEEIRQNIEEMQAITDELNLKLFQNEQIISGIKEISYYAEFDNQGRIIEISDPYLKILQKEKSDMVGKIQGSFSTEARNIDTFNTFWEELRNGNVLEYQQIINVEGEMKNIHAKYYPVKNSDGLVTKIISIAQLK